ncbi:MAG: glycosyl transferase family 1 [Syntrophus sp. (in: bacteria)]|nr:glycosyl transferase family 1 [Syntrophus sp. (in: bacteria)]
MKILVSAYACEPDKGSEPGVGWNWAQQISRFHNVWVITRTNNKESIDKELTKHPNPNIKFNYVDVPDWLSFWKKGQKGIYMYYFLWQIWAFRLARQLRESRKFDVVHHVTFGTVWLPTFMPFLGIPFIWGPIGGAERVPKILRSHLSSRAKIYENVRDLLVKWTFSFDPLTRAATRKACLIIARTNITLNAFSQTNKAKIALMIETGISKTFLEEMGKMKQAKEGNRVLMVGRLLHLKGFDLGIEAFLRVYSKFPESKLMIIGAGPEEEHLKKRAEELAKAGKVFFTGQMPRLEVLDMMRKADIFLMPSMKDAGAWVIFEAMASGLPVVCLDYAGPGEIVDDSCAIRVPVGERSEVVKKIGEALDTLLSSKPLQESMGRASIRRLESTFLWSQKGEIIRQFYEKVSKTKMSGSAQ